MQWTAEERCLLVEAGQNAFVRGQFFAAHEHWEVAWLGTPPGGLREGLRGLVQWTAAAHHHQQGVVTADRPGNLLARARARLQPNSKALKTCGLRRLVVPADAAGLAVCVRDPAAFLHFANLRQPLPVAALLLAGGQGRRAGGPKALKVREGQPLWRWQVEQLQALGCQPVIAVLHPDAWLAAQPPETTPDVIPLGSDPGATPLASVQRGLPELPEDRPFLLLPVDCPCPPRAVALALVAAALEARLRGRPWRVVRPVIMQDGQRRGGHPILLAGQLRLDLQGAVAATHRLDHLLAALPDAARIDVAVDDPAVLANFNADGVSI